MRNAALHDDFRVNAPGFQSISLKLQIRLQFVHRGLDGPGIGRNGILHSFPNIVWRALRASAQSP
jgi:hypothetical protein